MLNVSTRKGVLFAVLAVATPLSAQTYESVSAARQYRSEENLHVSVSFAVGSFVLRPDHTGSLYRAGLTYDHELFRAVHEYSPRSRTVALGVRSRNENRGNFNLDLDDTRQKLEVTIAPQVPVNLELRLGAGESEIELGGLSLERITVESGATVSNLNFDSLNQIECEEMAITVGAAEFAVYGLSNSRCRTIKFKAGAGEFTLDFSGIPPDGYESEVEIELGLAVLTLRLPSDAGVAIEVRRFLASFDSDGLIKRGSVYYSPNYDAADYKLNFSVSTIIGSVEIEWLR